MSRKYEGISEDKARGTWTARYRIAPGPKGTRTRRGFATQAEAKRWRDAEVGKVATNKAVDPRQSSQTVGAIYELWIADYRMTEAAPLTVAAKECGWNGGLKETFEDMPLSALNRVVIRRWQNARRQAGAAKGTINNHHTTLSLILDYAIELGALDHNYAKEAGRVKGAAITKRADPNASVIARLVGAVEPRYLIVLNLALYAGLRSGEARGLRLKDVRRNGDGTVTLFVREQMHQGGRKGAPKGGNEREVIESEFVADLIEAHVAFYGSGPDGEIVTNPKGAPLPYGTWKGVWKRTVKEAGVTLPPRTGLHYFRHAYASYAIANGASPAEVAANLGHAQVSTTFAYYVHATDRRPVGSAAARQAIEAAEAELNG